MVMRDSGLPFLFIDDHLVGILCVFETPQFFPDGSRSLFGDSETYRQIDFLDPISSKLPKHRIE